MAKDYKFESKEEVQEKAPEKSTDKTSFITWFSKALESHEDLKAHHMSAVRAHFSAIGMTEQESEESFNKSLRHYGIN